MLVQDCCLCFCCSARTQELEQQQPGVEEELRRLLEKPGELLLAGLPHESSFAFFSFNFALSGASDNLKSRVERRREETLMQRLVEIVDGRNAIVEGLDEDRRR